LIQFDHGNLSFSIIFITYDLEKMMSKSSTMAWLVCLYISR